MINVCKHLLLKYLKIQGQQTLRNYATAIMCELKHHQQLNVDIPITSNKLTAYHKR